MRTSLLGGTGLRGTLALAALAGLALVTPAQAQVAGSGGGGAPGGTTDASGAGTAGSNGSDSLGGGGGGAAAAGGAGGSGGNGEAGGAGGAAGTSGLGTSSAGGAGGPGSAGTGAGASAGGGGGGAGYTQIYTNFIVGNAFVGSAGGAGGLGGSDFSGTGAGGGGGVGAGILIAFPDAGAGVVYSTGSITGGAGGAGGGGGSGIGSQPQGGGGGGGGNAIMTLPAVGGTANSSITIDAGGRVTGGAGGAGGTGGSTYGFPGAGGAGGAGGNGFAGSSYTILNAGTISGGNGGAGGLGGTALDGSRAASGANGAGGAGITGSSLKVITSGTIAGGLSGDGATRADALAFTGGTNVLTLQAGAVLTGNISNTGGGTLTFDQSTDQTLASAITGDGAIIQDGTGTLILTGANTYSGPTQIASGTLQIGDGGTSGSLGSGPVSNLGRLVFDRSDTVTVGSSISGTGSLVQQGTGTLNLNSANSYSGGTVVQGGTLVAGVSGALGTGAVTVNSGATLGVNNITLGNAITLNGTGAGGAGALLLNGLGNALSGPVMLGSDSLIVLNNQTTVFTVATFSAFNGGGHALTINGTGRINGLLSNISSLTVQSGDVGLGNTNVTAPIFVNGGILRTYSGAGIAGNSIGDLTRVNLAAGATLDIHGSEVIGSVDGAGTVIMSSAYQTFTTGGDNTSTSIGAFIGDQGNLIKEGTGTFTVVGDYFTLFDTRINGGTLRIGNGGSGGKVFFSSADYGGKVVINGGTLAFNRADDIVLDPNDQSLTHSIDPITGTGNLVQMGPGSLTLLGANSYSGGTTVQAGTLVAGVSGALGTGAVTVNSGATLGVNNVTLGNAITLNGTGAGGAGALLLNGPGPSLSGPVTLGSDSLIVLNNQTNFFNGATLSAFNGGGHALTINGSGRINGLLSNISSLTVQSGDVRLGDTNVTAPIFVNGGILRAFTGAVSAGNSIGDLTRVNLAAGATLDIYGSEVIGSVDGAGTVIMSTAYQTFTTGGDNTSTSIGAFIGDQGYLIKEGTGTFTVVGDYVTLFDTRINGGTLRIGNGGSGGRLALSNADFGGKVVINGGTLAFNRADDIVLDPNDQSLTHSINTITGTGNLVQMGPGSLTLLGANSYSGGTTVQAGTLVAGVSGALGTGAVTVNSGATLGVNGTVALGNAITLNGSGIGGAGALVVSNQISSSTIGGPITLGSDSTIGMNGVLNVTAVNGGGFNLALNGNGAFSGAINNVASLTHASGAISLMGTNVNAPVWVNGGSLTVVGDGIGDLSRVNIAAGATLSVYHDEVVGSVAGAGSIVLESTGNLLTGGDNTSTAIGGIRSGAEDANLTKQGSGTFTVLGDYTVFGRTKIDAGTLQIGNGGSGGALLFGSTNFSSIAGVIDNGTLAFNRADDIALDSTTFDGTSITGSGSLVQMGPGKLTIAVANSYSGGTVVRGGTLVAGVSGALGTGAVSITGGTLIAGAADALSGNGSISIASGGTLDLGGFAQAINQVVLDGGTLASGTLSGAVSSSGGTITNLLGTSTLTATGGTTTLTGTNAFGGITVQAGASVTNTGTASDDLANAGSFTNTGTMNAIVASDTGTITNALGALWNGDVTSNAGIINNAGTWTGDVTGNAGTITNTGTWNGNVLANSGLISNSGTWAGTIVTSGQIDNTGTLTLSGAINGLSNSGTANLSGTVSGAVANSGTIVLTGATSGIGAVNQGPAGSFDLGGNATAIGSLAGGGTVALGAATLTVGGDNTSTAFAGVISGSGGLTKTGTGTFTLSGDNTYTGLTTVGTGTLVSTGSLAGAVQNNASFTNTGSVAGLVTNAGTLASTGTLGGGLANLAGASANLAGTVSGAVSNSGAIVLTGATSGIGAFSQGPAGSFDLGGFSTSVGSLAGSGTVALGAASLTTGSNNASTSFGGAISGSGGLTKVGTGTFTLTGVNTYSGSTTINAGSLIGGAANAFSAASTTTIASGGTLNLGGFAQAINQVVLDGGTLAGGTLSGAVSSSGGTITNLLGTSTLTATGGTTTLTGTNAFAGIAVQTGASVTNQGVTTDDLANAGTFTNTGTMNAIVASNSGTITNAAAAIWNGNVTGNTGTISNSGAWNGNVLASSGAITNAGTWTGTVSNSGTLGNSGSIAGLVTNGGTLTSTGTLGGGLSNSGTANLAGTLGGAVINTGGITVTGALTANGAFAQGSTGSFDLGGNAVAIGSLAGSGTVALGAATLTVGGDNTSTAFAGVISGSGGLTKTGKGTFTLSGAETYAGLTTVGTGTLASTGSLAGAVQNNASFTNTGSVAGLVTNAGTLASTGTLGGGLANLAGASANLAGTVSGAVSNSGAIVLIGATSGIGAFSQGPAGSFDLGGFSTSVGSLAGSGTVALGAGSLTTGSNNASTSFGGAISGSGGLTKVGTGEMTLGGANTYTGLTTVGGGSLVLASGGVIAGAVQNNASFTNGGSVAGLVTNGGALTSTGALNGGLTNSGSASVAGSIVGPVLNSGQLQVSGAASHTGTTTNSGAFAVAAGSYSTSGQFTNSGALTVASGATLDVSASGLTSSGSGASIDLSGTLRGPLMLSGGSFFGRAGSLLAGNTTIAHGATFADGGTVSGAMTVNGTLAPGNSLGTITVNGSLALGATSTTVFEMTNAVSDKIVVNGSLTIASGATLQITGSRALTPGVTYSLITTTGGITGSFSTITKAANVFGFIRQTANTLDLMGTIQARTGTSMQASAIIDYLNNQMIAGGASNAFLNLVPQLVAADGLANEAAILRLGPEPYASAASLGLDRGLSLTQTLRAVPGLGRDTQAAPFVFAQGFAQGRNLAASAAGVSAAQQSGEGILGGIGYGSSSAAVSAFIGNGYARQTIAALGASTRSNGVFFGARGQLALDRVRLGLTALFDQADAQTTRAPLTGPAEGSYTLHGQSYDAQIAYTLPLGAGVRVEPSAGITYVAVTRGALTEIGAGALNLALARQRYAATWVSGDIALSLDRSAGLKPWLWLGLRHRIAGDAIRATGALAGLGGGLTLAGAEMKATYGHAGAGFEASLAPNLVAYANGEIDFGAYGGSRQIQGGLRYSF